MLIGIDLDNTIINYDRAFHQAALAQQLVTPDSIPRKRAVKAALPDDLAWQRLQGFVYGSGIGAATPYDGVEAFFRQARSAGHPLCIVSHKTEFGHFDATRTSLRDAARDWLMARGFIGGEWGIAPDALYFESTRAEKVARIAALGCDWFIDDLSEVFAEPGFPATTRPFLFAPDGGSHFSLSPWESWAMLAQELTKTP